MKFVENRNKFFIASIVVIVMGLLTMCFNAVTGKGAFEQDIEFKGGSLIQVNIEQKLNATIKNELVQMTKEITGDANPGITAADETDVIITMTRADAASRIQLFKAIKEKYNLKDEQARADSDVSPSISEEIKVGAFKAVVLGTILILIYITFRFKDFKFGASAVIALLHDVLVMLAVYAIFRIPLNNSFIAAMLTIVGYSINDTIIVFDRIRENKRKRNAEQVEIINSSITQTLTRSINTSITTLVMIVLLFIFGTDSVKEFAFPLIIGVAAGTYSSIFVASPLCYVMSNVKKNSKKKSKPKTV